MIKQERNWWASLLERPASIANGKVNDILNFIQFETDGTVARVIGSDGSIQVKQNMDIQDIGTQAMKCLLPARKIMEIIKLAQDNALISLECKSTIELEMRVNRSRYKLITREVSEFPIIAMEKPTSGANISGNEFIATLSHVGYASAKHDVRHYLNGVCLLIQPGVSISLSASNGHVLAREVLQAKQSEGDKIECIIPVASAQSLLRLLGNFNDALLIQLGLSYFRIKAGTIEIVGALVEGKFPDINKLIKNQWRFNWLVTAEAIAESVGRARLLTDDKQKVVVIALDRTTVTISASGSDGSAEDVIEGQYDGDAFQIGFNADYLLNTIQTFKGRSIRFGLNSPNEAVGMMDADGVNERVHVLMPYRVGAAA